MYVCLKNMEKDAQHNAQLTSSLGKKNSNSFFIAVSCHFVHIIFEREIAFGFGFGYSVVEASVNIQSKWQPS